MNLIFYSYYSHHLKAEDDFDNKEMPKRHQTNYASLIMLIVQAHLDKKGEGTKRHQKQN